EGFEQGIGNASAGKYIEAAPIPILLVFRHRPGGRGGAEIGRNRRVYARAADAVLELAGSDKQSVTNFLGFQTLARENREQLVVRIGFRDLLAIIGGLAIGAGQQDLAMQ